MSGRAAEAGIPDFEGRGTEPSPSGGDVVLHAEIRPPEKVRKRRPRVSDFILARMIESARRERVGMPDTEKGGCPPISRGGHP